MDAFLFLIRLFISGIFVVAGVGKLVDPVSARKVMKDFGVPEPLAVPTYFGLSILELAIGSALLFTSTSWYGSIGSLVLMLIFLGGMIWQMSHGRAPDCHCFGQLHSEPVSKKSIVRNAIFAALSVVLVAAGPARQGLSFSDPAFNTIQAAFGVVTLVLFITILFYVRGISQQQQQVIRRLELLELLDRDGKAVERNEAGDPNDSLPIGGLFPDFELPDLAGNAVNLGSVLEDSKPSLFIFVAPNCDPCGALVPEFEKWQTEFNGSVNLIFVSRGSAEENFEKFGDGVLRTVVLQKNRELAELVHALWTPSAVLVDAEGRIRSHVAVGDEAIRNLVEEMRKKDLAERFTHIVAQSPRPAPRKIGEHVPEFSLRDLNGVEFTADTFRNKRTLVAFWSLTCPHCQRLMEEIRDWEKSKNGDSPDLVLLSDGDPDEHRDLGISSPILLDKGYKIAAKLGIFGTPSGVLIDEDGRFVSETAIGGPNIWSLVKRS